MASGGAETADRRAFRAAVRGRHDEAVRLYGKAIHAARESIATHPNEFRHREVLGAALYEVALSLAATGRSREAVEVLYESEAAFDHVLTGDDPDLRARTADVRSRRALVQSARGYAASAVPDVDAALVAMRALAAGGQDTSHTLDLARTLAIAAHVQLACGDPDLAVTAADSAVRLYLRLSTVVSGMPTARVHARHLCMAADVAAQVHAARDRPAEALAADELLVHTARPRAGSDPEFRHLLATALTRKGLHLLAGGDEDGAAHWRDLGRRADARSAGQATARWKTLHGGDRPVTLAAAYPELHPAAREVLEVPSDRYTPETAADHASRLAAAVPSAGRPGAARRIALEAHFLFAAVRRHLDPAPARTWARLLLDRSQAGDRDGDPDLALDLATWAHGVIQHLPADDPICLPARLWHARLLISQGDSEAGERILKRLR